MGTRSGDSDWNATAFWAIFKRSRIPMGLIDAERRYVAINDAAVDFYGFPREEVIGRVAGRLLAPEVQAKLESAWEELKRRGEYYGDDVVRRADGRDVRFQYAAHAHTASGRWLAVMVVLSARFEPDGPELIATDPAETADAARTAKPPAPRLTARERDVVRLVALGAGTRQVAAELFIAPDTARSHVRNAMGKLDAHTRAQLVAIALAEGLIEEP